MVLGLAIVFELAHGSDCRVKVRHIPTVWRIGTLLYSQQSEKPEVFVELSTDKSIQFINTITYIVIFPHRTVQTEVRHRSQN